MMKPDPKPQEDVTAMGDGSGPPKDSGAETVPVNKHEEQKKGVEELKIRNENDSAEEMNGEGEHGVEKVKDGKEKNGVEEGPDGKAKNSAGETKVGGDKSDLKEMDGMEETKENERKNGIINGVEETKEGSNKDSVKDVNDEKDTKKMEEKMTTEEKEGADKTRDGEGKTIVEEINDSGEKEGSEVKKNEEGKMDKEKRAEDEEAGEGGKGIEDVEMVEAEDVKEEDRVVTDVRTEDEVKPREMDDEKGKEDGGNTTKEVDDSTKAKTSKKKRSRSGWKVGEKVEAKEKKEEEKEKKEEAKKASEANVKKEGMKKVKEKLSFPTPSVERPVRERKTVERLVEVIEKEPNKVVVIEKGRGTPLKNIPNVAHKLARKKPGDLKLLHQTLFGRKGKAVDFKNHILQFSGFAWHESDEKKRAKVKEKLDKCVKDTLLDLCDLLDISVSKTNSRKEDLITKLLDFMAAPHATTDVLLAEKEQQSPKSRKRKMVARGSASKGTEDTSAKRFRKKRMKSVGTPSSEQKSAMDTDDEDNDGEHEKDDSEHGVPDEDEELERSESEKESESKGDEKDEDEDKAESADEESGKGKEGMKKSPKKQNSSKNVKVNMESSSKKTPPVTTAKSPTKTPSSTWSKPDERNDVGEKVFVRKKKIVDPPKKKSTSKPDVKEKSSGKRGAGSKTKSGAGQSNPSKEELRKVICKILKKVDFNTATFTDILKQLAIRYKVDLTPRKAAIKLMIREELTKLAVEAEDNEDDQDSEKEEHHEPTGKKVKV